MKAGIYSNLTLNFKFYLAISMVSGNLAWVLKSICVSLIKNAKIFHFLTIIVRQLHVGNNLCQLFHLLNTFRHSFFKNNMKETKIMKYALITLMYYLALSRVGGILTRPCGSCGIIHDITRG